MIDHSDYIIGHIEMNKAFFTIVEKSQDLIFFISEDGEIKYATPAVRRVFGFSIYEYMQFNIMDLIHHEDLPDAKNQMKEVLNNPAAIARFQLRNLAKDGHYRWVEGTVTNMLREEGIGFLIAKFTDITERKACEQEQEKVIQDLNKRMEDLNQFVYIISHNLKTPLSNLIGLINILELDMLDDYNKGIVELFKNSTDRLNETVYDLTQILSLKSNQGVKISNINIQDVFEKVSHSFTEQINQMNISITASFDCKYVLFNKSYIESILLNLMSNSIKYRDQYRKLEIRINLQRDKHNNCVLTFTDNGIGIDMESAGEQLFGLHKRFHNHVKGNGVGLFITKSQIISLGGSIEVSSKVDEGTTFKITFKNQLPC